MVIYCFSSCYQYKNNEIINVFTGDKFLLEMLLKQPGFTYSACGPFTKYRERIQNFMQTGNTHYIYKNYLDKACFQHDMAYGKCKDLTLKRLPGFNLTPPVVFPKMYLLKRG